MSGFDGREAVSPWQTLAGLQTVAKTRDSSVQSDHMFDHVVIADLTDAEKTTMG